MDKLAKVLGRKKINILGYFLDKTRLLRGFRNFWGFGIWFPVGVLPKGLKMGCGGF
ncbi:hypothetical protein N8B89_01775 [Enterococcus faecium]